MSRKSLILSSSGLKNIIPNINNSENEFLFIFGEEEVRMSKVNADFISPLISRLHQSDPTTSNYKYPSDEIMKVIFTREIIIKLNKLCRGESIEIDEDESRKLEIISILLWNEELQSKLNELYPIDYQNKSMKEIIKELSHEDYIRKYGKASMISKKKIDHISNNFYILNNEEIEEIIKLPKDILYSIVSNPGLKLVNEDTLFEFIKNILKIDNYNNDYEIINEFYSIIVIENLSNEAFREFIEIFNDNNMSRTIWLKIKHFLLSLKESNKIKEINSPRYTKPNNINCQKFEYNGEESGSLKGIIAHLTEKCGGNVNDKNEVIVTSSSNSGSGRIAKHAVDLEDKENFFESGNKENSWLKYDFKNRKVHPTHYTIRTHKYAKNDNHLQHWIIEGSNTDQDDDWKKLDSRNNITVLNGPNQFHTFDIQENLNSNEFFRYLRIRHTGKNTNNNNYLVFSALEYFGTLI